MRWLSPSRHRADRAIQDEPRDESGTRWRSAGGRVLGGRAGRSKIMNRLRLGAWKAQIALLSSRFCCSRPPCNRLMQSQCGPAGWAPQSETPRKGGRVVECARLEIWCTLMGTVSSNLTLSAKTSRLSSRLSRPAKDGFFICWWGIADGEYSVPGIFIHPITRCAA